MVRHIQGRRNGAPAFADAMNGVPTEWVPLWTVHSTDDLILNSI